MREGGAFYSVKRKVSSSRFGVFDASLEQYSSSGVSEANEVEKSKTVKITRR